jgi:hypothetical protein
MTAMKPQNSNAEILRAVLLGVLLYFHDLSISIGHNGYFSVPNKEKRQKSQAKTSQFILSCRSHEVESVKRQKSQAKALQFILSCRSHEVESVKRQKSQAKTLQFILSCKSHE